MAGKCRFKFYSLSALLALSAGSLFAEEKAKAPAKKMDVNLIYRAALNHDDHGLEKTTSYSPVTTFAMDYEAWLLFTGEMGPASFTVLEVLTYDATTGTTGTTNAGAWGTFKFSDMFKTSAGLIVAEWGGYAYKNWTVETSLSGLSHYLLLQSPFADFGVVPGLQFDVALPNAGTITLQLVDDVVKNTTTEPTIPDGKEMDRMRYNTANKSPVPILAYNGTFGPVSPMLQFFQYDAGHSSFLSLGAKIEVADLTAFITYAMQSRAYDMAGTAEKNTTNFYQIAANYKVPKAIVRFAYSGFTVKESPTKHAGNMIGGIDDNNESLLTLAVDGNFADVLCRPYLEMNMRSAKILNSMTDVAGSATARSSMSVAVGLKGML